MKPLGLSTLLLLYLVLTLAPQSMAADGLSRRAQAQQPKPPAAQAAEDIRDIKSEWPSGPVSPWVVMLAALAGLLAMVGVKRLRQAWRRRRAALGEPVIPQPGEPPHLWALRELEALARTDWLESGETDAFIVRLTEILKRYLEMRWSFPATRCTSLEILESLQRVQAPDHWTREVRTILAHCDLEKFAGVPYPVQAARRLLRQTEEVVGGMAAGPEQTGGSLPVEATG